VELIDDPQGRAGLSLRGRVRARDFAAAQTLGRVVGCYQAIASPTDRPGPSDGVPAVTAASEALGSSAMQAGTLR
jgi:hypothetical protein